ncbi:MAG TPA: hypothetical protein DCY79_18630, partial [Planctomycetaceae bacterium]|nr:hypothetical protein [Planctomycetaceae bacterium]
EPEPEPEVPPEPDHQDAVAALKDLGVRLVTNEHGNAFRVIFYEQHGDEAIAQIRGLHSLKEVWLVGSKATKQIVDQLKESLPEVTVYHD